jgi:hypothetical protein
MTKNECTEAEGIAMMEAAGYTITFPEQVSGKGCHIWEGETKLIYSSDTKWLKMPGSVMNQIKRISSDKGVRLGTENLQKQLKTLLNL